MYRCRIHDVAGLKNIVLPEENVNQVRSPFLEPWIIVGRGTTYTVIRVLLFAHQRKTPPPCEGRGEWSKQIPELSVRSLSG
jgi:hypothetical protein